MSAIVTADDVIAHFAGRSARGQSLLREWRERPERSAVVPAVEAHVARVAHLQTSSDVETACRETDHALGDVKWSEIRDIDSVRDWHPDFAFTHVLHQELEERGRIPTWQDLKKGSGPWKTRIREPALHRREQTTSELLSAGTPAPHARQLAGHAIQWRLGNAYYSFLRELFVIATLRDAGIDARCHPLADALYRADVWVGDTIISLYIGNPNYLSRVGGRKHPVEQLLSDAKPRFSFLSLELETQHSYGVVHLPEPPAIAQQTAHLAKP